MKWTQAGIGIALVVACAGCGVHSVGSKADGGGDAGDVCKTSLDCGTGRYCDQGSCKDDVCEPSQKSCQGNAVVTCAADGSSAGAPVSCPFACVGGACTGLCVPGTVDCDGLVPRTCNESGQWQSDAPCSYLCSAGACSGACTPGTKRCSGQIPQSCNANGQWESGTACTNSCLAGVCGGCTSGAKRCNGLTTQTCDANGQWKNGATCTNPHGQAACTNGACTPTCTAGYDSCDNNPDNGCETNLQTDSSNCKTCGNACGAGEVCSSGTCQGCIAGEEVGGAHSCAVKVDGTLWCWGSNTYGEIGNGVATTTPQASPVEITALGKAVKSVSAGLYHTCAVKDDGTLWCWGDNYWGQIGDGTDGTTVPQRSMPVEVTALGKAVKSVSAGGYHTCAVKTDGSLWCWGRNAHGQLGNGNTNEQSSPVEVTALGQAVKSVSAGESHTCAIKTDGSLWCWGDNSYGELGNGGTSSTSTPVQVLGSSTNQVAADRDHTCALQSGAVWCWGENDYGQVGDGTTKSPVKLPSEVTSLGTGVASLGVGLYHACARKIGGTVWCWGYNAYGQLGDGTTTSPQTTPVQIASLGANTLDLAVGGHNGCVRKTDGTLWCWGRNSSGQVGVGSVSSSVLPNPVPTLLTCP